VDPAVRPVPLALSVALLAVTAVAIAVNLSAAWSEARPVNSGDAPKERRNAPAGLAFDADHTLHTDQTPAFDPTEAEPVPDFDFDRSLGA